MREPCDILEGTSQACARGIDLSASRAAREKSKRHHRAGRTLWQCEAMERALNP